MVEKGLPQFTRREDNPGSPLCFQEEKVVLDWHQGRSAISRARSRCALTYFKEPVCRIQQALAAAVGSWPQVEAPLCLSARQLADNRSGHKVMESPRQSRMNPSK